MTLHAGPPERSPRRDAQDPCVPTQSGIGAADVSGERYFFTTGRWSAGRPAERQACRAAGAHRVGIFDPAARQGAVLASLEEPSGSGVAVSPDGAWLLYVQRDEVTSDILVLEELE